VRDDVESRMPAPSLFSKAVQPYVQITLHVVIRHYKSVVFRFTAVIRLYESRTDCRTESIHQCHFGFARGYTRALAQQTTTATPRDSKHKVIYKVSTNLRHGHRVCDRGSPSARAR
jgi:hypothetical protein